MRVKKHFFDYIEEFPYKLGTTNREREILLPVEVHVHVFV